MKTIRFPRSGFLFTTKDSERELVNIWLSMSREERKQKFAGTARAAEMAGVSQRTVQFWIDAGYLMSLRIGKKASDLSAISDQSPCSPGRSQAEWHALTYSVY
jgi:hypothetical protein